MEVLRREQEDEDYTAFAEYASAGIREASNYMTTLAGRGTAAHRLQDVVSMITKQPSGTVRLRMQAYLVGDRRFIKMVEKLGDETLKAWVELAT
jgi:hypothetical protein